MTLFTRSVARDFRSLLSRCIAGRPRGPAPPVVVQIRSGVRTLAATTAEGVILTHASTAPEEPDDLIVLPALVLAEVEANSDDEVTLDRPSKTRGTVKWFAGATPRTLPVELIVPGKQHDVPAPPQLTPGTESLLTALHECGRSAARESGRYALSKVQVQGRAGRIVGTDGKVALLWKGFTFPFEGDALVPALPVFGAKPLARFTDVRVGRTATHLVVAAGPWCVWLPVDPKAKYPDVVAVIPRSAPTTVTVHKTDAADLVTVLPVLPGADHELRPLTIEAGPVVRVCGHGTEKDDPGPVVLSRSGASGPITRAVLDRRVLARMLALGCNTLKLTPDKPVVAVSERVTLVAAQLDPALAAVTNDPSASTVEAVSDTNPSPERNREMKPETNGHVAPRGDPADPLELAEELRTALSEAAGIATRLVAALRHGKKEKKVLSAVLTNLKQLNLGGSS